MRIATLPGSKIGSMWPASWGAKRARVIAGKAEPSKATLAKSQDALMNLADYAGMRGLRLMTENWHNLLFYAGSSSDLD